MPGPLSYEPSVGAVLAAVLPAGSRVLGGRPGLRRRVAWPVLARATGLGTIDGGELIVAPAARSSEFQGNARELDLAGVSGLVVEGDVPPAETALPVIAVPAGTDLRRLVADIERYVARRRRELFALDRELHHLLVDPAIAGAPINVLLRAAADRSGRQVAIDRDGDVEAAPGALALDDTALVRARLAARSAGGEPAVFVDHPAHLALGITAGRERRGTALLVAPDDRLTDDDEALLASLASAAAIAFGRERDMPPPPVDLALESLISNGPAQTWTALAIVDPDSTPRQLERAVRSELDVRGVPSVLARDEAVLIAFLADGSAPASIAESVARRVASTQLRAGGGRMLPGHAGARRSAREAGEALQRSEGVYTAYADIEMQVLLSRSTEWQEYAGRRLSVLLGDREDDRELLHTLRTYLLLGRNGSAAADSLRVHRNTLQYRLRRIEERLEVDLSDPDTAFALDLAVRVLDAGGELTQPGRR